MSKNQRFTIRVYGFLLNENKQVLVSDEYLMGNDYTKISGGGLTFGESTHEALIREYMEELKQPISVKEHIYTTDFFVCSKFRPQTQLMAIYYLIETIGDYTFRTKTKLFDYDQGPDGLQSFRWVNLHDLNKQTLSFATDVAAAKALQKHLSVI